MNNIILIFGSGIHKESLNDPDLNKRLEKLGRKLLKTQPLKNSSNVGGLQADAPDLKDPVLQDFFKAASHPLAHLVKHYELDAKYSFNFQSLWFNLNRKGDYNLQHSHGNTDFSAAYWIKSPPDSGDIVFINPNYGRLLLPLASNNYKFKTFNALNSDHYRCKAKAMELCIFPAELQHYVMSNNNTRDRMSLSFNVRIVNARK